MIELERGNFSGYLRVHQRDEFSRRNARRCPLAWYISDTFDVPIDDIMVAGGYFLIGKSWSAMPQWAWSFVLELDKGETQGVHGFEALAVLEGIR